MASSQPFDVEDYRRLARKRLPKIIFDYLEGGADDEVGLKHNRAVFERVRFMPHRLVDVSRRDMSIDLFGRRQTAPMLIAPTGLNGALWPKGDILLARAAEKAGIPFAPHDERYAYGREWISVVKPLMHGGQQRADLLDHGAHRHRA